MILPNDSIKNIPRSLASSTKTICFRCLAGEPFKTLWIVLMSELHASLLKMITTLALGRSSSYCTLLHLTKLNLQFISMICNITKNVFKLYIA